MKNNVKNWCQGICAGLLVGGAALLSAGCADVGYAGASYGYYDYDYYPEGNVYFYPQGGIYYWNDAGHWRSGRRIPERYEWREEHREHLRLHSREPWIEHHEERRDYDRH
jgi:hypothetical protein